MNLPGTTTGSFSMNSPGLLHSAFLTPLWILLMAMTTSSSISVNPRTFILFL